MLRKPTPTTSKSDQFPWHTCRPGESFFVPSLDPERTRQIGMSIATDVLGGRACVARLGIHNGMLGVMFSVKSRRPSK